MGSFPLLPGGELQATQYVVLDNLKEGVITPDLYEPELNHLYAAVLAHYGATADPARVRDPNRKGTVECAIQHTQSRALKGKRFASIEEHNAYLMHWRRNGQHGASTDAPSVESRRCSKPSGRI
jgi:transposase